MNRYLHIRISEELKEQAETLAKSKGLKLSDYIRSLLTTEVRKKFVKSSWKVRCLYNLDVL